MAKQFKIYFSKSKEKVTEIFDPAIGEEKCTVRRAEIELLTTMFKIATSIQTDIGKGQDCRECVSQVSNIDKEKHAEFTKDDLKYAKEGYAKFNGRIGYDTIDNCNSMLAQIDSPFDPDEEIEWDTKLNKFKARK
jgi:hypothetical protein